MSLGGLALCDRVYWLTLRSLMVENGIGTYLRAQHQASPKGRSQFPIRTAAKFCYRPRKQVGRPIFFSLIIIVVSSCRWFLLEFAGGTMFRPLAYTKSFRDCVLLSSRDHRWYQCLMVLFIRGKRLRPEEDNPISRFFQAIYLPVIRWCLPSSRPDDHRQRNIRASYNSAAIQNRQSVHAAALRGLESLHADRPSRNFRSPSAVDRCRSRIRSSARFPEVESVFWFVGRSDSATDNAAADMYDTTIMLSRATNGERA